MCLHVPLLFGGTFKENWYNVTYTKNIFQQIREYNFSEHYMQYTDFLIRLNVGVECRYGYTYLYTLLTWVHDICIYLRKTENATHLFCVSSKRENNEER